MRAGKYFWKQIQSTLAEYYIIILMNVRSLFYGKRHWKKGLFRMKPSDSRTNNRFYTNKLRFMINCVIS